MGTPKRPRARWLAVGVLLLAVAGVSAQVSLVRGHPLGQGSISSSLGLGSSCSGFKPTATMARPHLGPQRPCSACGEPTWLGQRDLAKYDKAVPLLCAPCVGTPSSRY